jgi:hypothetical protein
MTEGLQGEQASPEAPRITEEDVHLMENPDEHFDPDAPPQAIDAQQAQDAEVTERDGKWISPRERVGGD